MRTIRHVKAAMLAGAILATAGAVWCSAALAQPSSNDINRLRPTRDLTRSIPSPAPSTPATPSPPGTMRAPHHPGVRCPGRPSLTMPSLSDCPASQVLIFGQEEAPTPQPVPAPPPPQAVIAPAPQPVVTPIRPIIITHDMIGELQSKLQDAGNYAGPISGVFDFPTRNALIAWQRANGKKPTGALNATTLEEFGITRQ